MQKLFLLLIILSASFAASPVFALTVSPARFEIAGDPGQTLSAEIEIFNEQKELRHFFTSFENFEPKGDSGAPSFIGANGGLATWMATDAEVTIESGERKVIPFTIAIPENAEPGGHFAAVFFGTQPPQSNGGGEVSIGGKIGVLILLRVNGDIEESGGLVDFTTQKRFVSMLPLAFSYRINNTGGDRVVPKGEIVVRNSFFFVTEKLRANANEGSVLPGSIRKFETVWAEEDVDPAQKLNFFQAAGRQLRHFHFGWYRAHLDISWGSNDQSGRAAYNFFVVPWQLLSIVMVLVLIGGFFGRIGIKKYNAWIIAQATGQKNG